MIINVSNPSDPSLVTSITNDAPYALNPPSDISTVTLDSSTFALVTSYSDDSVQIIDITDPYNLILLSTITNGMGNYTALDGPLFLTTVTIDSSTFALVTGVSDNGMNGIQIINITDPYNPTPASAIIDDTVITNYIT